jgi:hypothetical protein
VIELLNGELLYAIDHQLRNGSNLQTQPTDNPRSLLIRCLEFFELGDRLAGGMGDRSCGEVRSRLRHRTEGVKFPGLEEPGSLRSLIP